MKNLLRKILFITILVSIIAIPTQSIFAQDKKIVIGGKNFTDQYIMPEIARILLENEGFDVTLKTGVGTTLLRKALESGQVDMYFEYTGSAYTVFFKQEDKAIMTDPDKIYNWVKNEDAKNGLVWTKRIKHNNTYTLMMRKEDAEKKGIYSISDLAAYVNKHPKELIFGMNPEFWERPDGFRAIMKVYGFKVPVENMKKMSTGLCYTALKEEKTNASMGFSTDGRIVAFGFINLKDDKHFFPVYNPCPVIRKEVLDKYPEINQIIDPMRELGETDMQHLNKAVDVDRKSLKEVSEGWLKKKGFIK
ncbi:MAG: glycine betaine ABC transporter substrate-binding protein [Thermodesulfobacteriota bacterium]|nr:glycine betaine ABC transporter substrate-binding protein [Thermodesulfobacteriota bacterium]